MPGGAPQTSRRNVLNDIRVWNIYEQVQWMSGTGQVLIATGTRHSSNPLNAPFFEGAAGILTGDHSPHFAGPTRPTPSPGNAGRKHAGARSDAPLQRLHGEPEWVPAGVNTRYPFRMNSRVRLSRAAGSLPRQKTFVPRLVSLMSGSAGPTLA